jgi:hypothetical protein
MPETDIDEQLEMKRQLKLRKKRKVIFMEKFQQWKNRPIDKKQFKTLFSKDQEIEPSNSYLVPDTEMDILKTMFLKDEGDGLLDIYLNPTDDVRIGCNGRTTSRSTKRWRRAR